MRDKYVHSEAQQIQQNVIVVKNASLHFSWAVPYTLFLMKRFIQCFQVHGLEDIISRLSSKIT